MQSQPALPPTHSTTNLPNQTRSRPRSRTTINSISNRPISKRPILHTSSGTITSRPRFARPITSNHAPARNSTPRRPRRSTSCTSPTSIASRSFKPRRRAHLKRGNQPLRRGRQQPGRQNKPKHPSDRLRHRPELTKRTTRRVRTRQQTNKRNTRKQPLHHVTTRATPITRQHHNPRKQHKHPAQPGPDHQRHLQPNTRANNPPANTPLRPNTTEQRANANRTSNANHPKRRPIRKPTKSKQNPNHSRNNNQNLKGNRQPRRRRTRDSKPAKHQPAQRQHTADKQAHQQDPSSRLRHQPTLQPTQHRHHHTILPTPRHTRRSNAIQHLPTELRGPSTTTTPTRTTNTRVSTPIPTLLAIQSTSNTTPRRPRHYTSHPSTTHSVPTCPLRRVQRAVTQLQQITKVRSPVLHKHRNTNAHPNRQPATLPTATKLSVRRVRLEQPKQPHPDRHRMITRHIRKHDHKLITTQPERRITTTQRGLDHLRNRPKHRVTSLVTERVVHFLKPVEVDRQHRKVRPQLRTTRNHRRNLLLKITTISKPGQRIRIRKVRKRRRRKSRARRNSMIKLPANPRRFQPNTVRLKHRVTDRRNKLAHRVLRIHRKQLLDRLIPTRRRRTTSTTGKIKQTVPVRTSRNRSNRTNDQQPNKRRSDNRK